jgi:hypothetical protein
MARFSDRYLARLMVGLTVCWETEKSSARSPLEHAPISCVRRHYNYVHPGTVARYMQETHLHSKSNAGGQSWNGVSFMLSRGLTARHKKRF